LTPFRSPNQNANLGTSWKLLQLLLGKFERLETIKSSEETPLLSMLGKLIFFFCEATTL
jgi:hypothetical protein